MLLIQFLNPEVSFYFFSTRKLGTLLIILFVRLCVRQEGAPRGFKELNSVPRTLVRLQYLVVVLFIGWEMGDGK